MLTKEELDQLQSAFKDEIASIGKEINETLQKQGKEISELGESRTGTAKRLDHLDERYTQVVSDLKEAQERAKELELKLERNTLGGIPKSDEPALETPAQQFVKSEKYKHMIDQQAPNSGKVEVKGIWSNWNRMRRKEVSRFDTDGETRLLLPMRVDDVLIPVRQMVLRDLLNVSTITSDSVQWVQELGFAPLHTVIETQSNSGQKEVTVEYAEGFFPGQTITVNTTEGAEEHTVDSVNYDDHVITTEENLAGTAEVGMAVTSMVLGGHIERMLKPQSDITLTLRTEAVKDIASWIPAPRQTLADIPRLRNYIDMRLMNGLELTEEYHILFGDGSDRMLSGILTNANRQQYAWSDGKSGDTKIDAVRRAATLASLAEYPATGVVMHQLDWEDIELQKGSDKHYIWVTVTQGGEARLWRMPVIQTQAIPAGRAVVGAWGLGATLYDRQQASIEIAREHEDYFARNMVAIRAEERLVMTVERPEAFVDVSFDDAPAEPS